MPHGAHALHTWRVDMTGESLPGGEKKKKEEKKRTRYDVVNATPHVLYIQSLQSHRCMVGWI